MQHAFAATALVIVLLASGVPLVARAQEMPEERPPHAPIVIAGDGGFLLPPEVSGVTGGSGTEEDPYVIEGWTFVVPTAPLMYYDRDEVPVGILLHRTTAHVVIRGNTFLGTPDWTAAAGVADDLGVPAWERNVIRMFGSANESAPSISIVGSRHVMVEENLFLGTGGPAVVVQADGPRFWLNLPTFRPSTCPWQREACESSRATVIARNTFDRARTPVIVVDRSEAMIVENHIRAFIPPRIMFPLSAIALDQAVFDRLVEGNTIELIAAPFGPPPLGYMAGIGVVDKFCQPSSRTTTIRGNMVRGFPYGIHFDSAEAFVIDGNNVERAKVGIYGWSCGDVVLRGNHVSDSELCIAAYGRARLTANAMDACGVALEIGPGAEIDLTNTVDGGATYRLRDLEDTVVDAASRPAGWLYATGLRNVTLRNFHLGTGSGAAVVHAQGNATGSAGRIAIESSSFQGRSAASGWTSALSIRANDVRLSDVEVGRGTRDVDMEIVGRKVILQDVEVHGHLPNPHGGSIGILVRLQKDAEGVSFLGGTVRDARIGIAVNSFRTWTGEGYVGQPVDVFLEGVTFTNNMAGLDLQTQWAGSALVRDSSFVGNSIAIDAGPVPLDARDNWWGSPTGPMHASNPDGTGDAVSDNVLFDPWRTSPP